MLKPADAAATGHDAAWSQEEIANFGGNLRWFSRVERPADEEAVGRLLESAQGETIRVISSGHSWSYIAAYSDIALDLSALDSIGPIENGRVRVGAGCRIQRLLDHLHANSDRTLPTVGVIKQQTVAGAISTGTHGSGKQSLSHFVTAVRMIVFDAAGRPEVRNVTRDDELYAARCGLGCVGVILSVEFETVPKYWVAETVSTFQTVEQILGAYAEHPLSAIAFWPHENWLLVQRRRIVERPRGPFVWLKSRFFRLFTLVFVDLLFALFVLASVRIGRRAIKLVQRFGPRALIKNSVRIDDAEHVLTMRQDIFAHEEMEIFVPESDLPRALRFAHAAVEFFAGDSEEFPDEFKQAIETSWLPQMLCNWCGSHVLNYPIYCRRILPDDTLVSMTAAATEPWFSISFFTYEAAGKRGAYYDFCFFVARTLKQLAPARLHWGKHVPLRFPETVENHPRFDEFRRICVDNDPNGALRNAYTAQVLGLPPGPWRGP